MRKWGRRWVDRAWEQLADLYPPAEPGNGQASLDDLQQGDGDRSRTCGPEPSAVPNPALAEHRVPLVRQTWLARKKGRYIALRAVVDRAHLTVSWEVVRAATPEGLGFDPAAGSKRGQATCRICGATITYNYVRAEGSAGRMDSAPLAAVLLKTNGRGRDYLPAGSYLLPDDQECLRRLEQLPVEPPDEPLPAGDTRWFSTPPFGLTRYRDLFTPRQLLTLCTLSSGLRDIHDDMVDANVDSERVRAVITGLALCLSRLADYLSTLCRWHVTYETAMNTFARQALPMVWDFLEVNPFGGAAGDVGEYVATNADIVDHACQRPRDASHPLFRYFATDARCFARRGHY